MIEPRPDAKETRVVNVRNEPYDVYIGRRCRGHRDEGWGNPFAIGRDGNREEVISKYRVWLRDQPELQARVRRELRGKILGCWCKPDSCHGDVLATVAEGLDPTTARSTAEAS